MRASLSVVVLVALAAGPAAAADTWSDPAPGVRRLHRVSSGQDLHVVTIDLCAPGVSMRATASSEKGRTVSSFGNLVGADVAVNGDFFGSGFGTDGPARHAGAQWSGTDHTYVAPIAFGPNAVSLSHHNNEGGPPAWAQEVVSGHPTLLDDGTVVGNPGDGLCTNRHPRTAFGISEDHRTAILLVVDGRRTGASGMTCDEMAFTLASFGAFDAVNMDGGGSSTLWLSNGGVVNQPSDGSQRTVGNHLAVIATGSGPAAQCPTPAHRAEFVAQSFPAAHVEELVLQRGEVRDGWIDLKNTGSSTWGSSTRLAPTPRDVPSPLAAATWMAPHRVSHPTGAVAPGETGRFPVPLYAATVGSYDQTFGVVEEGVTWFADEGGPADELIRVRVRVVPPADAGVVPGPADAGVNDDVGTDASAPPDSDEDAGAVDEEDAGGDEEDAGGDDKGAGGDGFDDDLPPSVQGGCAQTAAADAALGAVAFVAVLWRRARRAQRRER